MGGGFGLLVCVYIRFLGSGGWRFRPYGCLLLRFSKVSRRKGGTISRRYQKNGYTHQLYPPPPDVLKQILHLLQNRAIHLASVGMQTHIALQHVELGVKQISTRLE